MYKNLFRTFCLISIVFGAQLAASPDLIVINADVRTSDKSKARATAFAIKDSKFIAVGDTDEILSMSGESTRVIDADGNTELTKIIGSVADEKNNNAYFFSAAPVPDWGVTNINPTLITSEQVWIDSIIEIDIDGGRNEAVFVDRFAVTETFDNSGVTVYNYNGAQGPP